MNRKPFTPPFKKKVLEILQPIDPCLISNNHPRVIEKFQIIFIHSICNVFTMRNQSFHGTIR